MKFISCKEYHQVKSLTIKLNVHQSSFQLVQELFRIIESMSSIEDLSIDGRNTYPFSLNTNFMNLKFLKLYSNWNIDMRTTIFPSLRLLLIHNIDMRSLSGMIRPENFGLINTMKIIGCNIYSQFFRRFRSIGVLSLIDVKVLGDMQDIFYVNTNTLELCLVRQSIQLIKFGSVPNVILNSEVDYLPSYEGLESLKMYINKRRLYMFIVPSTLKEMSVAYTSTHNQNGNLHSIILSEGSVISFYSQHAIEDTSSRWNGITFKF